MPKRIEPLAIPTLDFSFLLSTLGIFSTSIEGRNMQNKYVH